MEVPRENIEGMWESVDTTNDSWAYAWYDEYWKSPKEILKRLIACVGRGGTYMLNIGPKGDGSVPQRAVQTLTGAGEWIHRYPQVVYNTDASPWHHALPWGDVTRKDNTLFLCVFDWPTSGKLYLPNLRTKIASANLLSGGESVPVTWNVAGDWTVIDLPPRAPEKLVSVIQVNLESEPVVDPVWALDPGMDTEVLAEFAEVEKREERPQAMDGEIRRVESSRSCSRLSRTAATHLGKSMSTSPVITTFRLLTRAPDGSSGASRSKVVRRFRINRIRHTTIKRSRSVG